MLTINSFHKQILKQGSEKPQNFRMSSEKAYVAF